MAAKKRRRRKMPAWKRWARQIVSAAGAVLGGGVALSPTFRGIQQMTTGDLMGGVNTVVFDTTGMDPSGGTFVPKIDKIIGVGVVAAVGIGLMMLFRAVARRV